MTAVTSASSAGSEFDLWLDLLEVILYGVGAGVGLAIAFALAMRGLILGGTARREGRAMAAAGHLTIGMLFTVICITAVGFALLSMVHR